MYAGLGIHNALQHQRRPMAISNVTTVAGLTRAELLHIHYQMALIRRFEEKSAEEYTRGKIGGFMHLYIGQEAVGVGCITALRPSDKILCSYREHGHALADGMDVISVYETMTQAVERARAGEGPSLLEIKTYRFRGHSMTDPSYYRTREEEHQWRTTRDPIGIFEKKLLDLGLVTQAELDDNDARATQVAEDAAEFADNSPDPELAELYTDIMVDESTALTHRYERK